MKKAILFIACFAIMAVTLSAFADRGTAPVIGYRAPGLSVESADGSSITLEDLKGENVLLTFWSSSDAASRLRCNEYNTLTAMNSTDVRHVAVNFDRSERLYNEVVRHDDLTPGEQYHVEGLEAIKIMDNYHLDRGLHSFLINPKGRIIAIDPDAEQVKSMSR